MKDEIAGGSGGPPKPSARGIIFLIGLVPVALSCMCFFMAGLEYIILGNTDILGRILNVAYILVGVSFVFAFCGALVCDTQLQTKDEDEC